MSMGLLKTIGIILAFNRTGNSKSFSKQHYEVMLPIIELSKVYSGSELIQVSLSAFGEQEVMNWTRLFTMMVPHVTSSLSQGSCIMDALTCIRVFIKFHVFEKKEVYPIPTNL